jgi:hypothetical protein
MGTVPTNRHERGVQDKQRNLRGREFVAEAGLEGYCRDVPERECDAGSDQDAALILAGLRERTPKPASEKTLFRHDGDEDRRKRDECQGSADLSSIRTLRLEGARDPRDQRNIRSLQA